MRMNLRIRPLALSLAVLLAIAAGVLFAIDPFGARETLAQEEMQSSSTVIESAAELELPAWMDFELEDALTGEAFRIRDLVGRPILVESFAVWCSTCLRQQKEMAKLIELEGDRIVHIALDTDPNEDLETVRKHALRYGFDWYYAVAPIEMTQMLIEAFGLTVVNAPRAPVVLIEEDGTSRLLESGVKSAEELLEATGLEPTEEAGG